VFMFGGRPKVEIHSEPADVGLWLLMSLPVRISDLPVCLPAITGTKKIPGVWPASPNAFNNLKTYHIKSMLGGSLVTTAWRVLRLRMEEMASRYGGYLRIY
jgi:hypothetical protein